MLKYYLYRGHDVPWYKFSQILEIYFIKYYLCNLLSTKQERFHFYWFIGDTGPCFKNWCSPITSAHISFVICSISTF